MCGINGFNFKDENLIQDMIGATKHRGPDQDGSFCDKEISLGSARLSIIDLTERGRQPIWNEDKTICVILNGEIYNFKELRGVLEKKGHAFYSDTDTEVIVHLYEEHRERCVDFLNGIFAFALWDLNQNMLYLARDRVGVKPLYYYFDGKKLIFSSEIKAILCHPIKKTIEESAFPLYFKMFYVPGPLTLFKNIFKLQPGHFLTYKNNSLEIKRYWDIEGGDSVNNERDLVNGIRELFSDSVKRQLVGERPVGIFLSGGIDSTAVLGAASEILTSKIKTFSVGFASSRKSEVFENKFNRDFYLARATGKFYNTDHHELFMSDKEARDVFEQTVYHMDEPVANPVQIATFLLAKEARKEVVVALGGDGGDELFGGYPRYYYSKLLDFYQILPAFLRKDFLPAVLENIFNKEDLNYKLNVPKTFERYLLFMSEKSDTLSKVLNPRVFDPDRFNIHLESYFPGNRFKDFGKYLMYLDLARWLPDESLMRSDKMTMAHGLEERVPILDHRLVELAFTIPTKYKVGGGSKNKQIFRKAMAKYLPPHIINKDKKGWFSPASIWLREGMKDFAYEVLSSSYCSETSQYLNFTAIREMLDRHIAKKQYNLDTLWSLLTFQVWHKKFFG